MLKRKIYAPTSDKNFTFYYWIEMHASAALQLACRGMPTKALVTKLISNKRISKFSNRLYIAFFSILCYLLIMKKKNITLYGGLHFPVTLKSFKKIHPRVEILIGSNWLPSKSFFEVNENYVSLPYNAPTQQLVVTIAWKLTQN